MNSDSYLPFHQSWLEDDEINEVVDALKSGWLTTGPKTKSFEEAFKNYIGSKHAIGLNSCTAGLHMSLAVQDFEPGDEVIVPPITFPATANVVVHQNLKPVFVDVEPDTLNLDAAKLEEKISPRTRAIIPVHFAGHACDMDAIDAVAQKHNLCVIEDAAHAIETRYKGRKVGTLGRLASFSFYATKNITTGEGGMLTTDDDDLAEKITVMRLHGLSRDAWKRYGKSGFAHWQLHAPGFKYNMSDINAAMGIHQIKKVDRFLEIRKRYAARYDEAFSEFEEVQPLAVRDYTLSARHIYVLILKLERLTITRDEFLNAMQAAGIGMAVHFTSLHLQPYFKEHFNSAAEPLPNAAYASDRIVSLPLYPKMTPADVERVISTAAALIQKHRA